MKAKALYTFVGVVIASCLCALQANAQTISPGTPTPVTISTPGQSAKLTFQGTAGQLASVQFANSTFSIGCYAVIVTILNPSGSTLEGDGTCSTDPLFLNTVALPTTGTYTLLIAPQNGSTGSATVTLSVSSAGSIVSGTAAPVTISTPGQSAELTFHGSAGQLASVQLANSTFSGCYSVVVNILNPDGSTLASTPTCSKTLFMSATTLPTTGLYTLVIAPQNGGTGSAVATLWLFNEQTGTTITPNVAVPVAVTIPGQDVQLTFSGTAGQSIHAQLTSSTFNGGCDAVTLSILNPDGSALASSGTCSTSLSMNIVTLPMTGTYTLVVAPQNGGTGTAIASLTLWPSDGQVGMPIIPGVQFPVYFNTPGQNAQYTFSGTAGEFVSVQIANWSFPGCYSGSVNILNPDGTTLAGTGMCGGGSGFIGPIALPSTGTYTLVLGSSDDIVGSANVALWLFQEQTGPPITTGTPATVTINAPGQDTQVTFQGTKGQLASLLFANWGFPGCYSGTVTILNPDGSTLTSADMCGGSGGFVNPVVLPATGTYTVVIVPWGGGTGSATLTLYLFQEQTGGTITAGTPTGAPTTVTINTPGQDAQLTFSGTKGQLISLSYAVSFSYWYSAISILNPDGSTLASACGCVPGPLGPVTLPATGTYTVVVAPGGGGTGSATLNLNLFQEATGTTLTPGTLATVTISTPGQNAQATFHGTAGQFATLQFSVNFTNWWSSITLLSPDGSTLVSACGCNSSSLGPVALPATGTYTVIVLTGSGGTGSANLTLYLFQEVTGTTLTSGTLVPVTINTPGQNAQLTFSGSVGQLATVLITNSGFNGTVNLSIIGPDGSQLTSTSMSGPSGSIGPVALAVTGTYTVLITPTAYTSSNNSADVTLSLVSLGTITSGTGIPVTISTPGQGAEWTFSGMAGQLASVQITNYNLNVACGSVTVSILYANGTTLASGSACGSGLQNVVLPATETYILKIATTGTGTATVTLSLSLEQTGGNITSGSPVNININTAGQNDSFTFVGKVGQLAIVQVSNDNFVGGCGNVSVSILNPDGTTLAQANACTTYSVFSNPVTLPGGGNYQLVIESTNGSTGGITVTLQLFQEQTGTQLSSGTPVPIAINIPGQDVQLTFSGTAGQLATVQVSNDSFVGGCGNVGVRILNPDSTTLAPTSNACGNPVFSALTLPVGGTYTVVISEGSGSTGSATVTLWLFKEQTGTKISSDVPATVTINIPGQTDSLTFSATAGQLADVQVSSDTFTGGCGNVAVSILSPDGATLGHANACGNPVFQPVTLPVAGTYTLVISEGSGSTGSAIVTLWLFKEQTGTKISSGAPAPVTINIPGQTDSFTFSATAGQLADVQVSSDTFTGGCGNVGVSILSPQGATLGQANACGNPALQPVALSAGGTYTLVISEGSGSTGSATVTLWLFKEVTGAITPGTTTAVSTSTPGQNAYLTFSGTAGQIVNLQLSSETFTSGCGNVSVSILGPANTALAQANACGSPVFQNSITLPAPGTYTLLIAPQSASSGGANALLSETGAPTATPTLSLATGTYTAAQSVTLADVTPGAVIYYTTNGAVPTTNSNVYTGSISISSTQTLMAMALAPAYSQSAVASAKYTLTLPVTPAITWATPADVTAGTALSATQLDASATVSGTSVAGTYSYSPAVGTVLTAGLIPLSVTFTPTNTTAYNTATATVYITVSEGASTFDAGTITLTVGGTVAATTTYGKGSTPSSIAQGLANGVTGGSLVNVTAVDGAMYLVSKTPGAGADYTYSLQTTSWDSKDFPSPSFVYTTLAGNLDGGANNAAAGQTVYSYIVPAGGYDGVGNLLNYTDSVMGTWSFQYDTLNRLAGGSASSQPAGVSPFYCWSYDPFGNRTNQAGSSAAFTTGSTANPPCQPASGATLVQTWATYNANNRITATNQAPAGMLYDQSGDVVNDGVNRYLYDGEGRICAVASTPVAGTTIMTGYIYDAGGTRVSKGSITAWSCDPAISGFQTTNDYILGLGGEQFTEMAMSASGTMAWQHTNAWPGGRLLGTYDKDGLHFYFDDFLGTRRAQTDYAGVPEQTCSSLPFGDGLACTGSIQFPTEHHFTGKERDTESGNDYFEARYYSSAMGRFMSPDWSAQVEPVPYAKLDDPQSLNLYAYVGNNPVSQFDADGHQQAEEPKPEGRSETPQETKLDEEELAAQIRYNEAMERYKDDLETYNKFEAAARNAKPLTPQQEAALGEIVGQRLEGFNFRYLSGSGGPWGGNLTRRQNWWIAQGWKSLGYAVERGGGEESEEYIPGIGGGVMGSTRVDITLRKGDARVRIQTVTTDAKGNPTPGEQAALGRIQKAFPKDQLIWIPKWGQVARPPMPVMPTPPPAVFRAR